MVTHAEVLGVIRSQFQCPSRRREWAYRESLVPWVLCQKGFDTGCCDSLLLLSCSLLGVIFVLFPDTTCMYALLFRCLPVISFLLVVFVVPDLQGCANVVASSFPPWLVFTVGDPWYLPVLADIHNTFYSRIYATENSYWLLLLTISVNHTITQN